MKRIIPIASGKGGVGKSLLTVNLGITLAKMGKRVILVDLDLGGSNLHTFLGLKSSSAGIGNFINRQVDSFNSLVIPTGIDGLFLVPGDGLLTGTPHLHYFQKIKIIKNLTNLDADFILLDLGAGTSNNVIDYFIPFQQGIIVTVPETTAILNAYSFLKTALSRALFKMFPPKSEERIIIQKFFSTRIEGTESNLLKLSNQLSIINPDNVKKVAKMLRIFYPGIIINMGRSVEDMELGKKLRIITSKNLGIPIEYIGYIPYVKDISRSILKRIPYSIDHNNNFTQSLFETAERMHKIIPENLIPLYEDNEDLDKINN